MEKTIYGYPRRENKSGLGQKWKVSTVDIRIKKSGLKFIHSKVPSSGIHPGIHHGIHPGIFPGIHPGIHPGILPGIHYTPWYTVYTLVYSIHPGIYPGMYPGIHPGIKKLLLTSFNHFTRHIKEGFKLFSVSPS